MPYGKTQDFANPTINDFETKATPQEKKLWESFLRDYPENFQRSTMADSTNFLFVCPRANLVVELEKFRRFADTAGGVSGKKGDALREMGLKLMAFTNKELDKDFDGVCAAIDRMVKRQISQESKVDIPKPKRLAEEEEAPKTGWRLTVSGEYKEDEKVGWHNGVDDVVSTYGGNAAVAVKNPVKDEDSVPVYGGNGPVVNPMKQGEEGYSYTRFNHRDDSVLGELPRGNWHREQAEETEKK